MIKKDGFVLYSTVEAAEYLGYQPAYLAQLRSYRKGPVFIKQGFKVYYPLKSLVSYAALHNIEVNELPLIGVSTHAAA